MPGLHRQPDNAPEAEIERGENPSTEDSVDNDENVPPGGTFGGKRR